MNYIFLEAMIVSGLGRAVQIRICKYRLAFYCCILILSFGSCNRNDNEYLKQRTYRLATGTVINGQLVRDNSENTGSCFVVNYKSKKYIATAYHLLAGRAPWDTLTNDNIYIKGQTPNTLVVWFYDKDGNQVASVFPLLDANKARIFLVPPADSINHILDLALYPLDEIPQNAVVQTIKIDEIDLSFALESRSKLFICGFRGDESNSLTSPIIDTTSTIDDFPVKYSDDYIFCNKTIGIGGASGGPVFYKTKVGKYVMAGMVSAETNDLLTIFTLPEMKNIRTPKLVYEFVSIGAIKRELDRLAVNFPK